MSTVSLGLVCGGLLGVAVTVVIVVANSNAARDLNGSDWAWIDVVSVESYGEAKMQTPRFRYMYYGSWNDRSLTRSPALDLRHVLREAAAHRLQIHTASHREFQAEIDYRLEHLAATPRLHWGDSESVSAGYRRCATSGLVWTS